MEKRAFTASQKGSGISRGWQCNSVPFVQGLGQNQFIPSDTAGPALYITFLESKNTEGTIEKKNQKNEQETGHLREKNAPQKSMEVMNVKVASMWI